MTPIERMMNNVQWVEVRRAGTAPAEDGLPYATHEGVLELGGHNLKCVQLSTGERVFEAESVAQFFAAMGFVVPGEGSAK